MSSFRGLDKRLSAILLTNVLLLGLALSLAWDRYSSRGEGRSDRLAYASELLAHGLPAEAVTALQGEIDAAPLSPQSLKLRKVLAEILMDKIGDYEKALAELVYLRTADPSQASATEDLVQRCMERLGRVYDVQRRLLLEKGINPLDVKVGKTTAVRVGNEEGITLPEIEQRLAQLGLPVKNPPQEQFDRVIQGMIGEILLRRAAKRAAIDRQPKFLEQVRQFEANLAMQKYLEEHVLKDVTVDEQALNLFLEKNQAQFNSPLRVVFSALAFPDETSARAFVNGVAPASPPQTLVDHQNAVQEDLPRTLKAIPWETDPPKGPLGPVEVEGKWMVYPIHEVVPPHRTAPDLARQQARLKLLEEKQGGKIAQMLGELSQKEEVKIINDIIQPYFFPTASKTTDIQGK